MMISGLATTKIPYFPEPPTLTDDAVAEITQIVFDEVPAVKQCDVLFIFGGSHPELWIHGAEAFHAGLSEEVIVTGGHKPTTLGHHTWTHGVRSEAFVIRDELVSLGVPHEQIHVESNSTNTLENVLFARNVYDFGQLKSILAVCKSYGAGRQCRTLRHHIRKQIQVLPYPFDTNVGRKGPTVTRENWTDMEASRGYIFGQFLKILKYGEFDHLDPVEELSDALGEVVQSWLATVE